MQIFLVRKNYNNDKTVLGYFSTFEKANEFYRELHDKNRGQLWVYSVKIEPVEVQ